MFFPLVPPNNEPDPTAEERAAEERARRARREREAANIEASRAAAADAVAERQKTEEAERLASVKVDVLQNVVTLGAHRDLVRAGESVVEAEYVMGDEVTGTDQVASHFRVRVTGEGLFIDTWQTSGGWKQMVPKNCLLYTSPSPRDATLSRMPSSA